MILHRFGANVNPQNKLFFGSPRPDPLQALQILGPVAIKKSVQGDGSGKNFIELLRKGAYNIDKEKATRRLALNDGFRYFVASPSLLVPVAASFSCILPRDVLVYR